MQTHHIRLTSLWDISIAQGTQPGCPEGTPADSRALDTPLTRHSTNVRSAVALCIVCILLADHRAAEVPRGSFAKFPKPFVEYPSCWKWRVSPHPEPLAVPPCQESHRHAVVAGGDTGTGISSPPATAPVLSPSPPRGGYPISLVWAES